MSNGTSQCTVCGQVYDDEGHGCTDHNGMPAISPETKAGFDEELLEYTIDYKWELLGFNRELTEREGDAAINGARWQFDRDNLRLAQVTTDHARLVAENKILREKVERLEGALTQITAWDGSNLESSMARVQDIAQEALSKGAGS